LYSVLSYFSCLIFWEHYNILVAISTSGNSVNIIRALETSQEIGIFTIGMTGSGGDKIKNLADMLIAVSSDSTPRIQEMQIIIGHVIC